MHFPEIGLSFKLFNGKKNQPHTDKTRQRSLKTANLLLEETLPKLISAPSIKGQERLFPEASLITINKGVHLDSRQY